MKKFLVLLSTAALTISLAACQTGGNDDIVIGANIYTYDDNFMNGVVRPELESYAASKGVKLELVDSQRDQGRLNDQVDTFISRGVDVLAINLVDPAAAATIIQKAKDANIPLILFNKEGSKEAMATYDRVWYVGTDSAEAGIIQGQMMVKDWKANPAWDKNGDGIVQYVLLKGEPGHPDAEARTLESVKAFTDASIQVEELRNQTGMWDTAQAKDIMDSWLSSPIGPRIELVITNNDAMAFGVITSMKAANVKLPVYGVDALAEALERIGLNEMNGTVLNDGKNQARATLDLAINAAKGQNVTTGTNWTVKTDGTKAVRVPYVPVTKDNYQDFK
jgi:methyl-galactoside transport system substrate-binding protein